MQILYEEDQEELFLELFLIIKSCSAVFISKIETQEDKMAPYCPHTCF